jgi:hypothetical protein
MPKEMVWAGGFIAGAVVTSVALRLLGVEPGILHTVLLVAGGVGVGYLLDRQYGTKGR